MNIFGDIPVYLFKDIPRYLKCEGTQRLGQAACGTGGQSPHRLFVTNCEISLLLNPEVVDSNSVIHKYNAFNNGTARNARRYISRGAQVGI